MDAFFVPGPIVSLRPVELADQNRLQSWVNDPEIHRFLLAGRFPMNRVKEEEWIKNLYKDDSKVVLLICLSGEGTPIGCCGLHEMNPVDRFGVLGILIGDKQRWGKGFGGEAVRLLVRYGFETLNLNRIELTVFEDNARAHRAYLKAGFVEESRLRKRRYKAGAYRDEIMMSVLRSEWSSG